MEHLKTALWRLYLATCLKKIQRQILTRAPTQQLYTSYSRSGVVVARRGRGRGGGEGGIGGRGVVVGRCGTHGGSEAGGCL